MEQFANAAVRHAEQIEEAGGAGKSARKREAEKLVDGAIARLEGLLRFQPGVERYNMMGAAQKRRAMLVDGGQTARCAGAGRLRVCECRTARGSADAARRRLRFDQRLGDAARIGLARRQAGAGAAEAAGAGPGAAGDRGARGENLSHSEQFWERALAGDCALLRLIGNGKPGHAEIDKVSRAYRAAAAIGARPREWNSVLSQIALLARLAESAGQDGIASALGRLRAELGH
jgi:hypothetical protein